MVIVFGSVVDDDDDKYYQFSLRATAVADDLLPQPIFQRHGRGALVSLETDARELANEVLIASERIVAADGPR